MKQEIQVLFIDDEDITKSTIDRLTIVHELDVLWKLSPVEGLNILSVNHQFKVVVLDIMMPTENHPTFIQQNEYGLETGLKLLTELNKFEHNKDLIKIFCSAKPQDTLDKKGFKEGVEYHHYFQKPYNTEELFKIINSYLK